MRRETVVRTYRSASVIKPNKTNSGAMQKERLRVYLSYDEARGSPKPECRRVPGEGDGIPCAAKTIKTRKSTSEAENTEKCGLKQRKKYKYSMPTFERSFPKDSFAENTKSVVSMIEEGGWRSPSHYGN